MQEFVEPSARNGRSRGRYRKVAATVPSSYLSPLLVGRPCRAKGGKGVYAREDIAAGTLLVVWGGCVLTRRELEARPWSERRFTLQVDDDAYLVSEVEGPADWVNHSCNPNAGLSGQISLVALRDIRVGEEICFDYAMSDASDYDEFDCSCGAPGCRGRVTGTGWMSEDLSECYAGYFSPYIQRRIRTQSEAGRSRRRAGRSQ